MEQVVKNRVDPDPDPSRIFLKPDTYGLTGSENFSDKALKITSKLLVDKCSGRKDIKSSVVG